MYTFHRKVCREVKDAVGKGCLLVHAHGAKDAEGLYIVHPSAKPLRKRISLCHERVRSVKMKNALAAMIASPVDADSVGCFS